MRFPWVLHGESLFSSSGAELLFLFRLACRPGGSLPSGSTSICCAVFPCALPSIPGWLWHSACLSPAPLHAECWGWSWSPLAGCVSQVCVGSESFIRWVLFSSLGYSTWLILIRCQSQQGSNIVTWATFSLAPSGLVRAPKWVHQICAGEPRLVSSHAIFGMGSILWLLLYRPDFTGTLCGLWPPPTSIWGDSFQCAWFTQAWLGCSLSA